MKKQEIIGRKVREITKKINYMKRMLTLVIVAACCLGAFPSEKALAQVKSQNEPTNAAEARGKRRFN